VRPGRPDDAPTAADLHAGQITEGFLSLLGPAFLARLYRRICLAPESFLLVATSGGRTVGFIAGSADIARLYRTFLWRDGPVAVVVAWRRLATGWRRVLETLRHATPEGAGTGRGSELLAVAVEDDWQGRGAGGQLVAAFLAEVTDRGGTAAYVVVGARNHGAIALYRRAGFEEGAHFELHPGTESVLMQWDGAASATVSGTT
jgi:ribosomal protein S18 acetylase RimI-like enzyme